MPFSFITQFFWTLLFFYPTPSEASFPVTQKMIYPNPIASQHAPLRIVNNTPFPLSIQMHDRIQIAANESLTKRFPSSCTSTSLKAMLTTASIQTRTEQISSETPCTFDESWGTDDHPILYRPATIYTITANQDSESGTCVLSLSAKHIQMRMVEPKPTS